MKSPSRSAAGNTNVPVIAVQVSGKPEMPCAECTQRAKQCAYQRLLDDELPLPSTSQALPETRDVERASSSNDAPKVSESSWDLGPATLYPPHMKIIAGRQKFALG